MIIFPSHPILYDLPSSNHLLKQRKINLNCYFGEKFSSGINTRAISGKMLKAFMMLAGQMWPQIG
jgi:hypothetical protein